MQNNNMSQAVACEHTQGGDEEQYLYVVLSPTDIEKFLKEAPVSQYVAIKKPMRFQGVEPSVAYHSAFLRVGRRDHRYRKQSVRRLKVPVLQSKMRRVLALMNRDRSLRLERKMIRCQGVKRTRQRGQPAQSVLRDSWPRQGRKLLLRNDKLVKFSLDKGQRPSTIPKRVPPDGSRQNKGFPVITVPVQGRIQRVRTGTATAGLPTQEEIKMREQFEAQSDLLDVTHMSNEGELLSSRNDTIAQLKLTWQDNVVKFEKMKSELHDRQGVLMELYATMTNTHKKMSALGQKGKLPTMKDIRMMSITKLSPDQLLQMCTDSTHPERDDDGAQEKFAVTVDMNKLYNIPTKLVATCEQTLVKRKEVIDWFESIKQEEKGIGMHALSKKIKEFNAENEMLNCSLQKVKEEFIKELNDIVDYIRKGVKDKITLQLLTEDLTCELSEKNAQNDDLRKQIQNSENSRSQNNRHRIEELEKDLKEEKCKKTFINTRLTRAEGQVKIGVERASQLEAALEQARSKTWNLERTVQQLHDQNKNLQSDFDKELNKLTESIRQNTEHLEDIAEAREKLQTEKEDLEKRLQELSDNYNESLKNMRHELNVNVAKHAETEQKYNEEMEERKKAESKLESVCPQLLESELRYKDILNSLEEKRIQLAKTKSYEKELETTKRELEAANAEIVIYRNQLTKQSETIREIEINFKETIALENNLKSDLRNKDEYIDALEKKQALLEVQLQESESKMESYEKQLEALKQQITQLQEEFGEFQNLNELHEMVIQQRAKLLEATRQNGELAEALQKKDLDLENHLEHLKEEKNVLEQREGVIKMLSEKDEEQANIIKLLRNNLVLRAQADNDIRQQLTEKNAEIDALVASVETRKQQISQLEKIILTLEDQLRKINLQKRKDHEKICLLEQAISEYEYYHLENKQSNEAPTENLDNLIKMLEKELGTPFGAQIENRKTNDKEYTTIVAKKKFKEERKREKPTEAGENPDGYYQFENEKPTKIVMGNYVKKTYITNNEEQYKGDNLDRKKAITNIDTQNWVPAPEPSINVYASPAPPNMKDNLQAFRGIVPVAHARNINFQRNLQFLISNQMKDGKKCKMFKFAGHRI